MEKAFCSVRDRHDKKKASFKLDLCVQIVCLCESTWLSIFKVLITRIVFIFAGIPRANAPVGIFTEAAAQS